MNGYVIDNEPVHEMPAVTRAGMGWFAVWSGIRDLPVGASVILIDSSAGSYLDGHGVHDYKH